MRSYEEMTDRVFERMAEYETKKKNRRKMIGKLSVTACGLAVVIAAAAVVLPKGTIGTAGGTNELKEYNGALAPDEDCDGNADGYRDGDWWLNGEQTESSSADNEADVANRPNQPFGSETSTSEYETWIEDYPMVSDTAACYALPMDGEWFMTIPLKSAISEYGNDAVYRVAVHVFDEGEWCRDAKTLETEFARLKDLGFTSVFETFTDNGTSTYQLSLHASATELLNFTPDSDYGYVLLLYKEALHEEQGW